MHEALILFTAAIAVFCAILLLLQPYIVQTSAMAQRLDQVTNRALAVASSAPAMTLREHIVSLSRRARSALGMGEGKELRKRFIAAGMRGPNVADLYFAAQGLAPLLGVVVGTFIPYNTTFFVFLLGILGYLGPDIWLKRRTKARQRKLRRSMPDAVDLLVICVEAGLGLDQAILRVSDELSISHPEIAEEFTQVNLEQRAGKARLDAWQSLADRTLVDEVANFVNMLVQTDRFGTPILKALTRFSEDLRMARRQHAEEAAAKTKIKIIFPLVLFIFPCLFIVLLAPALITIAAGFKAMN
jgi:tight adherence protein C